MNPQLFAGLFSAAASSGMIVYRWRGSDEDIRPLSQIIFALPYAAATWFLAPHIGAGWTNYAYLSIVTLLVFAATFAAVCTGHGGWQDLGTSIKARTDEWLEFSIKWLKPYLSPYWYDVLGMCVSGLAISLSCGIATLNPIIALSGLTKSLAYVIGWALSDAFKAGTDAISKWFYQNPTQVAEALTGLLMWGALASSALWRFA